MSQNCTIGCSSPENEETKQSSGTSAKDCQGRQEMRCLVENCGESRGAQISQVLSLRSSISDDRATIEKIEWWWGFKVGEFSAESSHNTFACGPALRALYDQGAWAWVPEPNVIKHYHDGLFFDLAERENFKEKDLPITSRKYTFVPLRQKSMEAIGITYQKTTQPTSPTDFVTYVYPFATLEPVLSQMNPKNVIYDLGKKLRALRKEDLCILEKPYMMQAMQLSIAWTAGVPSHSLDDPTFQPDPVEEKDDKKKDPTYKGGRKDGSVRSHSNRLKLKRAAGEDLASQAKRRDMKDAQGMEH